ncbi:NAD-dependent epimerase/dehydratase family protein [Ancylobacter pratisalsi]|uniref:NAD(P)-dependent oxidoreductase n=1 Tax=Ancylobacter pratisalsi TaxID=1745854 RepID=A0A6P1YHH1_9HYPH|nr:NAD(P)-dependent oxidoreductase [Ancylobacter pratisalsi]QIB32699.1 NAD(P)-dependent oxidoreductase [Ancylobacter pratisalsi]
MSNRVLIAGASGQLGPSVTRAFRDAGWHVSTLQRRPCETDGDANITLAGEWTGKALAQATAGVAAEVVVNLVGAGVDPGTRQPAALEAVNVALAGRLADLAARVGARAFITLGSGAEYQPSSQARLREEAAVNAADPYGRSKAEGGRQALARCAAHGIAGAHLRLFGMYGESERPHRLLPTIVRAQREGGRARLSAGLQQRDWLYERDIGEAVLELARALLAGRAEAGVYNLGSGHANTVRRFAEIAAEALGAGPDLLEFGAVGLREGEADRLVADTSRLRAATGWSPREDLHSGIARAIATMVRNGSGTG